jgi:proteasome accessory factor B
MSKRRTERLLSIVVLLLSARRYLTADEIRRAVIGYPEQTEAFKRMFERDKDELRELGIPLETGPANPLEDEPGYRISRPDRELPEIRLTTAEAAVLGIAARVWRSAELSGAAAGAVAKLKSAGVEEAGVEGAGLEGTVPAGDSGVRGDSALPGFEPHLTTEEPAFGPLWEAVRDRRPVTFSYRGVGKSQASRRVLHPWGVVNRRGRWYVAGEDQGAKEREPELSATRVFRMSRIEGPVKLAGPPGTVQVPAGTDVGALVAGWGRPDGLASRDGAGPEQGSPGDGVPTEAILRIRAGAGRGLRRLTVRDEPDPGHPGWNLVTVRYREEDWYAEYVASFVADVVVLEPPALRDGVIARLKGVLAMSELASESAGTVRPRMRTTSASEEDS